ncbi:SpaA isopeptide-forming pilin-related protein [Lacticaseibacillus chiayiensis]|uniref:SpaA isopeptide-forming pilin-related protein n=1 Tax=Lacticaseibacillus chiayiensis TaxID=2100821 RepID=UPI001FD23CA8|nr:SpaA isopeptide-forming pilin-related protein [Lacticaseibacillus chiayiensis]
MSFSNNQELKETHDANILDENQKIIGKYTYSGKNLQLEFLGHVSETVTIQLSLTNVSSLAGFVNFSVDGQKVAAKLSDTASATKVSKPLANVSSKMVSNVAATTQKTTSVSEITDGNDISQYLPDNSRGTIITGAQIVFTDANGNTVAPTQVTKDTNLNFQYTWAIPDELKNGYQVKEGDYFSFKLPEGITYKPGTGDLGGYGTYSIAADGTVKFTFNRNIENVNHVKGTFGYSSTISNNLLSGKENIVIETTVGPVTIPIVAHPSGGNNIAKTGRLTGANTSGNNPTGITWDVTINTNGQELKNATVSDSMPSDTSNTVPTMLKSVAVYPLIVDLNGNVTKVGEPLKEGTDYRVENGKITFIGAYADTYQAFKIEYTSGIDTSKLPDNGGGLTFKNEATLTNNGNNDKADATVYANYGKLLNKSFDGQDNNGGQKYNWHIDYNYGEKALPANTKLVDTLSKGQIFPADDQLKLVDEAGAPINADQYEVTYNADRTEMTITFPNGLNKGVKISYQSQVTSAITDKGEKISNSVTSNGQTSNSGDHLVGQQGLTKYLGAVDYNAKTVSWNFDINMARQDMSNWSMTDPVPDGLTVDYGSFVLKDKDHNITLKEGTDYVINKQENGFTISFVNALKEHAASWYTLSYKTSFDTNDLPAGGKWTNTATATWTDKNGDNHTNEGQAGFTPKTEFRNDGSKSGSYNAVTKQITWTVVANYNQRQLSNASITDSIIGDQDYVADSAKLYEASINADGSYVLGTQVAAANILFDSTKKQLAVKLPDNSSKTYVLIYQTSLSGKVIDQKSYDNTATYTNNKRSSNLTAQVWVPNSGNVLDKSGQQDPTDSSYALWTIWVNKAQSTIDDTVVTDKPSENQIIDQNSIVIYPGKVAPNGTFTEDKTNPLVLGKDYAVELQTDNATGQQTLKISFEKEINSAYSIHYRSLINSSKINDTLTNTASISGKGEKDVDDNTSGWTQVVNNNGSATGENTNLVLTKRDADTSKLIAGASFELWSDVSGQKGQKLRTGTTDSAGNITWNNLKSGKYILVETKAPVGYVIPTSLANGKEISLQYSDANADNKVFVPITNQQGKVTIEKFDADSSKPLAGAIFELYKKDGTKIASDLKTGSDGTVSYAGIGAGDYYIVETKAPDGYKLDATHHAFSIDGNNIQLKIPVRDEKSSGSVLLTKTDSDTGKALPGAVFDLYKADGTKVASGLTTDAKGQIQVKDLKPGDYYFIETAAPAGYELNDSKLNFTIALQTTTKVATVSATNAEKTGTVVLNKTDGDTGKALPGAVFDLYKADGTKVASGLTTDAKGQIQVKDLKPGDYYFIETAAPAGYELNDSKLNFTIELQTTTKVATVSATNAEKTGTVVLNKTDGDTGKALPGAVFDLYKADGTKVASSLTTDAKGQIQVKDLKPGDYYFIETAAPAGYELNDSKLNFTIALQTTTKVATVSATNAEKTGTVVLNKTDGDTGKALPGAVFDLYKADGTKVASGLTTDAKGQIQVKDLKPGDYYFIETAAPAGYELNDSKLNFTIALQTTTKVATVSATNAEKTGTVVLNKTDGDTGKALPGAVFDLYKADGTKVASGLTTDAKGQIQVKDLKPGDYYFIETAAPAGYELNDSKLNFTIELQTTTKVATVSATNAEKTGTVVLNKTDGDTGKALPGAVFDLYKADGTKVASGLTTDTKGQIQVKDLKPGDYYFVETAAPAGYELNDSKLNFTIELQTTTKMATVSATNAEKTGTVVLNKTDGDTGKALPGAVFDLYKADGTKVASGLTTDTKGQIQVKDLKPGDYYFIETAAPAGYELNDSKLNFTIELQTTTKVATVSATNAEKTGTVVLNKTDGDTGKALPGAVFDLYKADGTKVASGLTTDAKGQIQVKDLKPGDYYFIETAAPAGYELNDSKLNFTIELQTTTKVATVSATNAEKTGTVVLNKTDGDTGKALPGAVFDLYKADGTKVASGLTTDAKGQIQVKDLKPGDYYFIETAAPAGYELNDSKLNFTIALQTTTKVATVSATNAEKTGAVVLNKTDGDTGKALPGAVFDLYKADGTKVASGLTTDAKGHIQVNELKPGDYYFIETAAPAGYELSNDRISFNIKFQINDDSAVVEAKNFKKSANPVLPTNNDHHDINQNLPKTGDTENNGTTLIGIFSILGLLIYSFFKVYRRENS